MTLVVTRNVPERFRGFLASVMCEVTVGVYTSVQMSAAVRDRVWAVLCDWFVADCLEETDRAVVMTWPDAKMPGGLVFRTLGIPKVELHEHDGMMLVRCELTQKTQRLLQVHEERNRPRGGTGSHPSNGTGNATSEHTTDDDGETSSES
jgi:CRISPR-associated protein Cas2